MSYDASDLVEMTALLNPPKSRRRHGVVAFVPGAIVFAAALSAAWFVVLGPIAEVVGSSDWQEAPCVVVESRIEKESGGEGGSQYKPIVRYRYGWDGHIYESDRMDFGLNMSSNVHSNEKAALHPYPVGSVRTCYVDPHDPSAAVLSRSWGHGVFRWMSVPFLGTFASFGLWLMLWGWLDNRRIVMRYEPGPVVLRPMIQRLSNLSGLAFTNALVNGVVSTFLVFWLYGLVHDNLGLWTTVCLGLFLLPFTVFGARVFRELLKEARGLFAPALELHLESQVWPVGSTQRLVWSFPKDAHGKAFALELVCTEKVQYTRGTGTESESQEVVALTIAPSVQASGNCAFVVPEGIMPSWLGRHNSIEWGLKVISSGPGTNAEDLYRIAIRRGAST